MTLPKSEILFWLMTEGKATKVETDYPVILNTIREYETVMKL